MQELWKLRAGRGRRDARRPESWLAAGSQQPWKVGAESRDRDSTTNQKLKAEIKPPSKNESKALGAKLEPWELAASAESWELEPWELELSEPWKLGAERRWSPRRNPGSWERRVARSWELEPWEPGAALGAVEGTGS